MQILQISESSLLGGGGGGGVDLSAEKEVRTWLFKTKISAKS